VEVSADLLCGDGTFANLSDDDEDVTDNPQALIPYVAQPDPVVSQHAVVPYTERTVVASTTTVHNIRLNTARYGRRTPPAASSIQYREDGVIIGLDSDDKEYDNAHLDHAEVDSINDETPTQPRVIQGSNPSSDALVINDAPFHQHSHAVVEAYRRERDRRALDEGVINSDDEPLDDDNQIIVYTAPQDAPQDVPQDDPQDDPQDVPQGHHDLNRELQVNPQPSPALTHDERIHHDSAPPIPPSASFIEQELDVKLDLSEPVSKVSSPGQEQVFDDNGVLLGVDSDNEDYTMSSVPPSNARKPAPFMKGDNPNEPVPIPGDPNLYAPLAEDADEDEETPPTDTSPRTPSPPNTALSAITSQHGSPDGSSEGSARSYAEVASTNSDHANIDDPPTWTLTPLPDEGMRQRRIQSAEMRQQRLQSAQHSDKTGKREHPIKGNFSSRQQSSEQVTTPMSVQSTASNFCSDILSPCLGSRYQHHSSEDVTPANSGESEADTKPPAQPDLSGDTRVDDPPRNLAEGIQVDASESQDTDINLQSSSSSSHQPPSSRTRLTLQEKEAQQQALRAPVAESTRSRSAERNATPATTPQITPRHSTPNSRGRQHGTKGNSRTNKHKKKGGLDFR